MPGNERFSWDRLQPRLKAMLALQKALGMEELFVPEKLRRAIMEGPPVAGNPLEADSLDGLQKGWGECTRCRLCESRQNLVFGEGNPHARLVFVGEGPGQEEDEQGRPFVGKAGQLLTDIIEKGFKLRRSEVYIANIVKCRPPRNRDPETDEIETCIPVLWRQLELINPDVVCALGRVAAQALLGSKEPISALRGRFHRAREFAILPTFHPAYLLRNPGAKREAWEDIKVIMKRFPQLG